MFIPDSRVATFSLNHDKLSIFWCWESNSKLHLLVTDKQFYELALAQFYSL